MIRKSPAPAQPSSHTPVVALTAAGAGPLVIVGLLSSGPFSSFVVPEFVAASTLPRDAGTVVTLLSDLSESMSAMSIGVLVATAWLSRQAFRLSMRHLTGPILAAAGVLALSSIYAGLRFRFDLASQLRVVPLDFDRLKDRMFWQGAALLFQVSVLCIAATAHQLRRDRRVRKEQD